MPLSIVGTAVGAARRVPWVPPAFGNLITYGDIDMLSAQANGTGVSSWGEPIALTQATAAAQPTKQSDHVFFGADDRILRNGIATPATGSFVMFLDATNMEFGLPWVSANNDFLLLRFGNGSLVFRLIDTAGVQNNVSAAAGWNTGGYKTVCARYTPTFMSLVVNGVEVGTRALANPIKQSVFANYVLGEGTGIIGKKRRFGIYDKFLSISEINQWAT